MSKASFDLYGSRAKLSVRFFPFRELTPTIAELLKALKPLADIPRPYGDNEEDPINGDTVFPFLSPEHQEKVRLAEEKAYEYARTFHGQVDRRALTTMNKNGILAYLGLAQYNQDRLVGSVTFEDWKIDISDTSNEAEEDYED